MGRPAHDDDPRAGAPVSHATARLEASAAAATAARARLELLLHPSDDLPPAGAAPAAPPPDPGIPSHVAALVPDAGPTAPGAPGPGGADPARAPQRPARPLDPELEAVYFADAPGEGVERRRWAAVRTAGAPARGRRWVFRRRTLER